MGGLGDAAPVLSSSKILFQGKHFLAEETRRSAPSTEASGASSSTRSSGAKCDSPRGVNAARSRLQMTLKGPESGANLRENGNFPPTPPLQVLLGPRVEQRPDIKTHTRGG